MKGHLATLCKIVTLSGVGRYKFESKAHIIFDNKWQEVGLEQLPLVPFEEQPENVLRMADQNFGNNTADGKEIELLKSKIVSRPTKILSIYNELFTVSERAMIYKPMYNVTVRNLKTNKDASITIDGITGKTKENTKQVSVPVKKEPAKEQTKTLATKNVVNVSSHVKKN